MVLELLTLLYIFLEGVFYCSGEILIFTSYMQLSSKEMTICMDAAVELFIAKLRMELALGW